ncbi:aquaporin-10b [Melanotaenia boesemani]|uniref:aquaporin-10b n=1 Tax=Melanotaenia boesemani TaxID=1250792 RepID=UPI001C04B555|nr:aquaporin-10b [Melanotaenia boesemani]
MRWCQAAGQSGATAHAHCELHFRMSYKVNYSPLLNATPQPSRKLRDVIGSRMKGQTLLREADAAVLCRSDPPNYRVPSLKVILEQDSVEENLVMEKLLKKCRIRNQLVRECMAEFLGLYVLILFGCGSAAQVTLSEEKNGHYLSINLGFALGVTFGIFVSRGVSGAHLNPAVTLSLCVLGRHPWVKLPFYILFQVFGAFLAAATVGLQYYDAIQTYSGGHLTVTGPTATAGIFSTYPAAYLSVWGGIMDQVIGTAALLLCVLAIGDQRNTSIPDCLQPLLAGAAVMVIGVSMGSNSGYALNPARDFGPRLFTYIAGWGVDVFKAGGGWWWVPIVAPCVGALLGTLIYELLVEVHHPPLAFESQASCQEVTESKTELELDGVEPGCKKAT